MRRDWNVIAPGPSALALDRRELLLGPTVLVNRSVALWRRLRGLPLVWASSDRPQRLPEEVILEGLEAVSRGVELWVGKAEPWKELGVEPALEMHSGGRSFVAHDPLDGPDEWRAAPTLLLAIEYAVQRGARRLKVFGADMRGSCRFERQFEAWVPEEDSEEQRRWGYERRIWAQFLAAAKRDGISIERVCEPGDEIEAAPVPPPRPGKPIQLLVARDSVTRPFSDCEHA